MVKPIWTATRRPEIYDFLRHDSPRSRAHDGVVGTSCRTFQSYPQRYIAASGDSRPANDARA